MLNKKSQGMALLIIFLAIIIIVIGSLIFVGIKKGWFKEKEPVIVEPRISMFLKVLDEKGSETEANYYVEGDGYRYRQGKLEKAFNELSDMPINKTYRFCYWTDEHYRECDIWDRSWSAIRITPPEKLNESYRNMTMIGEFNNNNLKGKPTLSVEGKLERGQEQRLRLNVSVSNGTLKRISICTTYTIGIIYVSIPDTEISCPSQWVNYTFDDDKNRINLTDNNYWCNEKSQLEKCQKRISSDTVCISQNVNTPARFQKEKAQCYYTGISLDNSDYIQEFNLKTMDFINQLDWAKFYVIDRELTRKNNAYDFYDSGEDGTDNGVPDLIYQLNFTGE